MDLSLALKQLAVFLALMLSAIGPGFGCDVEVYSQQNQGLLIIETDVLNFGDVPVGFDVTQTLTLRNEGQRPLEIIGFDISPAASNFAIEGSTFLIAAKDSVTLLSTLCLNKFKTTKPQSVLTWEQSRHISSNLAREGCFAISL